MTQDMQNCYTLFHVIAHKIILHICLFLLNFQFWQIPCEQLKFKRFIRFKFIRKPRLKVSINFIDFLIVSGNYFPFKGNFWQSATPDSGIRHQIGSSD